MTCDHLMDEQAERIVLGSIIQEPQQLDIALEMLDASSFAFAVHRAVWESLVELDRNRTPIELPTLAKQLEPLGIPIGFLIECLNAVATPESIGHYLAIIKAKKSARLATQAAQVLIKSIAEGQDSGIAIETLMTQICDIVEIKRVYEKDAPTLDAEVVDHVRAMQRGDVEQTGYGTGFEKLDQSFRLALEDFIVVAARPGVGKSALALMFRNHLSSCGHSTGFISLEMPNRQLHYRTLASTGKIHMGRLMSGKLLAPEEIQLTKASNEIRQWQAIHTDQPTLTIERIRVIARRWHRQRGLQILFIDYLQLMSESEGKKGRSRADAVSEMSRGLKNLAKELKIPVVALCQLNREGADQRPGLHQLRESGAIEQDADSVIILHPADATPADTMNYELILAKNRNGATGFYKMAFQRPTQTFIEA